VAGQVKLRHDVSHGEVVRWSDVEFDADNETVKIRKAMEAAFVSPD
jgi:predicted homoserine dehydrogenase-like protein